MTEQPKDGGGAFPFSPNDHSTSHMATNGMSLRDWFAGQALPAVLPSVAAARSVGLTVSASDIAEQAYELADAMIAQRKEPTP